MYLFASPLQYAALVPLHCVGWWEKNWDITYLTDSCEDKIYVKKLPPWAQLRMRNPKKCLKQTGRLSQYQWQVSGRDPPIPLLYAMLGTDPGVKYVSCHCDVLSETFSSVCRKMFAQSPTLLSRFTPSLWLQLIRLIKGLQNYQLLFIYHSCKVFIMIIKTLN